MRCCAASAGRPCIRDSANTTKETLLVCTIACMLRCVAPGALGTAMWEGVLIALPALVQVQRWAQAFQVPVLPFLCRWHQAAPLGCRSWSLGQPFDFLVFTSFLSPHFCSSFPLLFSLSVFFLTPVFFFSLPFSGFRIFGPCPLPWLPAPQPRPPTPQWPHFQGRSPMHSEL